MDEAKRKLESAGSSCGVVQNAVDKLAQNGDLQTLWAQCRESGANVFAPWAACAALAELCAEDASAASSAFLSMAPTSAQPGALVAGVAKMMSKTSSSGLVHPLVKLLRSFPASWPHVHAEMAAIEDEDDLESLRPVFAYAFCDPNSHPHLAAFRAACLDRLVCSKSSKAKAMLQLILTWLNWPLEDRSVVYENVFIAIRALNGLQVQRGKLPFLASLILRCLRSGVKPQIVLQEAFKCNNLDVEDVETSLILLGKAISSSCEATLQSDILKLIEKLLTTDDALNVLVIDSVVANFLPLISQQAKLSKDRSAFLRLLLQRRLSNQVTSKDVGNSNPFSDGLVAQAQLELGLYHHLSVADSKATELWLDRVGQAVQADKMVASPLLAIAFGAKTPQVVQKTLEHLCRLSQDDPR